MDMFKQHIDFLKIVLRLLRVLCSVWCSETYFFTHYWVPKIHPWDCCIIFWEVDLSLFIPSLSLGIWSVSPHMLYY